MYEIIFILIFVQYCNSSLINRIQNGCEQPPLPSYLPDSQQGSYCRFHPRYSTLDLVFLIDGSSRNDNETLSLAQTLLSNSLKLNGGLFSNSSTTNDVSFVFVTNSSKTVVSFGSLNSEEEVAEQFKNLIYWRDVFQNPVLNLSDGLKHVHENVFNYSNGRGKLLTVIANNVNQQYSNNTEYADKIKQMGANIFSIGYHKFSISLDIEGTYLSKISTLGWHHPLLLSSLVTTNISLANSFKNFGRQSGCRCPNNTTQFTATVLSNNPNLGKFVKEVYSDCVFDLKKESAGQNHSMEIAAQICEANTHLNARPVALNTSTKYEFIKDSLSGYQNIFWTGKDDQIWITYNGTILPVENYLPPPLNDSSIQSYCKSTYNISAGNAAALVPYNDSYTVCSADPALSLLPLCEAKAIDAYDNPVLCPGPFVNADQRPTQIGSSCSTSLFNLYMDLIVIADVSRFTTSQDLKYASEIMIESFKQLNFDFSSVHSTRLALIVFSTLPQIKANFGDIQNVQELSQKFNLSKYSNAYDSNENALLAFNSAKSLLLLNKSHRRQGVIFLTSGFSNASDPYMASQILKNFDVRIITINKTPNDKIARLSSPGMNLLLNDKLPDTFSKSLAYANCYCPKTLIQFIFENGNADDTKYFSDCLKGFSTSQTADVAFDACKKLGGVPVSLTSETKSQFISSSVIFNQINKSPIYATGLKRHSKDINQLLWAHFTNADYSLGPYPPRHHDFSFDDLNTNCSMAVTIQQKTFIAPISCVEVKLPYICEIPAFDGDRFDIN